MHELEKFEDNLRDEWQRVFADMVEDLGAAADETAKIAAGKALLRRLRDSTAVNVRPRYNDPFFARGRRHAPGRRRGHRLASGLPVAAGEPPGRRHVTRSAGEAMRAWADRSPESAALLNPALLAVVCAAAASQYERESDEAMPWPLAFLVAPLVLHRGTREALPRNTRTHLSTWITNQPGNIVRASRNARSRSPGSFVKDCGSA